eukprot:1157297-Pelagomonas_calceolata.AAC.7
MMQGAWMTDQRKIGLGLTAFGILFTVLGMLMLFDRGLIAMGNVRICLVSMHAHVHTGSRQLAEI